jgi:serine protease Do/serine protease DegQ
MPKPFRLRLLPLTAFVLLAASGHSAEVAKPASALAMPALKVDASPLGAGTGGRVASYADMLEPVQQAVVSVHSSVTVRRPPGFGGRRGGGSATPRKQEGLGSGVIVSPDGFILTNNHVVEDADELTVTLADNREFKARLIGADEKTDIAVIKIDAGKLPAVTLADSDKLRVGDIVFAIGNPLGVGQTVTMGIVSATGRTELGILDDVAGYEDFIQTDAAINMGNSGGPLVDAKGRLIGLNSAIISPSSGSIGIGFSIPANLAASIMRSLVENGGKVVRGYLGVGGETLTAERAEAAKLPRETRGVVVVEVAAASPAAKAGLRNDDVITAVGGHTIASLQDFRLTVSQMAPGSDVVVKLYHDGKADTRTVRLAKLEETLDELLPGVRVIPYTPAAARALGLRRGGAAAAPTSGLIVSDVKNNSAYAEQLAPGQVISQINQTEVTDLDAARKLLRAGANVLSIYSRGVLGDITVNVR